MQNNSKHREARLVNILLKGGNAKRVPQDYAADLIANGEATRYISHTVYKALKLGIEVRNPGTRDTDGKLKAKIRAFRSKPVKAVVETEDEERPAAETRQSKRKGKKEAATA